MAELIITAAQVLPSTGAKFRDGIAGGAITAGQACARTASQTIVPADADAGTALNATVYGIAVNGASTGQPVRLQYDGDLILGAAAAPVVGTIYVLGDAAGGIAPALDLGTPDRVTVLGVGATGNILRLNIHVSGSIVPA